VKSSHAVSKPPAQSRAGIPDATTAFISRAPSRCARMPAPRATASTASICSSDHTRPPAIFVVCSSDTSRERGA
jgi:hypothetical protein